MLKAPLIYYPNSRPVPVIWDSNLNNNSGGWTTDGCHLNDFSLAYHNFIIFNCDKLGYYGLLQDISYLDTDGKT